MKSNPTVASTNGRTPTPTAIHNTVINRISSGSTRGITSSRPLPPTLPRLLPAHSKSKARKLPDGAPDGASIYWHVCSTAMVHTACFAAFSAMYRPTATKAPTVVVEAAPIRTYSMHTPPSRSMVTLEEVPESPKCYSSPLPMKSFSYRHSRQPGHQAK